MERKLPLCVLAVFGIALLTAPVFGQGKPVVAVLDLEANGFTREEKVVAVDSLTRALFGTGRFTVIARSDRDKILKEQSQSFQDAYDAASQVRVGRLLSANMIVAGSLAKVGKKIILDLRLIDLETSKILQTAHGSYDIMSGLINDGAVLAGTLASYAFDLALTGTTWEFSLGDSITFQEGGIVMFNNLNSTGKWKQTGHRVVFDCNGFTGYEVTVKDDSLEGVWYRIATPDQTNPTSLRKVKAAAASVSPVSLPGSIWRMNDNPDDIVVFYDGGLAVFPKTFSTGAWVRIADRLSIDIGYTDAYDITLGAAADRCEGFRHPANNPKARQPVRFQLVTMRKPESQSKSIAGTTWTWKNGTTARFNTDGTASFSHTPSGGHWQQRGDQVTFTLKVNGTNVFFSMYIFHDEMKGVFFRGNANNSLFHTDVTIKK